MRNTVDLRKREADTKPEPKQKKEKQEKSNDILISWQAPEYEYTKKHRDWYWAVGIITVAFAVVGVLIQNILFVILIILAGFTVALYGARKPRIADFVLTARGIKIGERFYPYDSLKSFWINYDPPGKKEIIFVSDKVFMPHITAPIGEADPSDIRKVLIRVLEEKEVSESLSEIIAKYLGF